MYHQVGGANSPRYLQAIKPSAAAFAFKVFLCWRWERRMGWSICQTRSITLFVESCDFHVKTASQKSTSLKDNFMLTSDPPLTLRWSDWSKWESAQTSNRTAATLHSILHMPKSELYLSFWPEYPCIIVTHCTATTVRRNYRCNMWDCRLISENYWGNNWFKPFQVTIQISVFHWSSYHRVGRLYM